MIQTPFTYKYSHMDNDNISRVCLFSHLGLITNEMLMVDFSIWMI